MSTDETTAQDAAAENRRRRLEAQAEFQKNLTDNANRAINRSTKNDKSSSMQPKFDYLPPAEDHELATLQERGVELLQAVNTAASLGLEDVGTQMRVAGLHEIATRCEAIARHIGTQAVLEGSMTQRELAKLLDVAPMTVNRMIKTAQDEQEPQDQ